MVPAEFSLSKFFTFHLPHKANGVIEERWTTNLGVMLAFGHHGGEIDLTKYPMMCDNYIAVDFIEECYDAENTLSSDSKLLSTVEDPT